MSLMPTISTSALGVIPSSIQLELEEDITPEFILELLSTIVCSPVDLMTYRPPALSFRNGVGTLMLRLDNNTENLLRFAMVTLRLQPHEYFSLLTSEGDVFVRLWWD